jgi:hypothetical protein
VLDATVVVFPVDERLRGYQSASSAPARPNQEGTFRITAVPPGEYLAVALQGSRMARRAIPSSSPASRTLGTRVTSTKASRKR